MSGVDVAACTQPVFAATSKADRLLFVWVNNSTRAVPEGEIIAYVAHRWP